MQKQLLSADPVSIVPRTFVMMRQRWRRWSMIRKRGALFCGAASC
jgi:hypothetical protein